VSFAVRPFGRVLLPMILAAAIVPGMAAAASRSAADTTGPAWAGSTAPVTGLNPAPVASLGDGVVLGSVSCPAAGSCVAVGHYTSQAQGEEVPLAESLSGGTWTAAAASATGLNPPPLAAAGVWLTKVSCPAVGSCVALGSYDNSSGERQAVIETLANGSWTATTAPAPAANMNTTLLGLSCPAAGSCVAVGYYEDQSTAVHPLIETLSGGAWAAADLPVAGLNPPAASGTVLRLVSCPAAGSCAAAGVYTDTSGHRQGLLASLTNGVWTAAVAPTSGLNPGPWTNPAPDFTSLSCPAAGSCSAVGSYIDVSDQTDAVIATLAGGTWSAGTAPVSGLNPPPNTRATNMARLDAVSCPAAGSCVAVGDYQDTSNNRDGFAATLSSGTWSAATIPMTGLVPTGLSVSSFTGISCPSAGACTAVGTYQDASGQTAATGIEHGLLETLSAGTWTATAAPTVALEPPQIYTTDPTQIPSEEPVTLDNVACAAAGSCVAVGYYTDPAKSLDGLIETLSSAPIPAPGYWIATAGANVYQFNAPAYSTQAATGTVGIAADGPGFQLVTSKGAVTSYNTANYGSHTGTLKAPVVGIAVNPATGGYYLATSAGNAYPFNTPFYGSKAGHRLPSPVDGIATDGPGYLLVTKAGNVYAFNTPFYGSKAGHHVLAPIVGITADPATGGYWLATSAGNVYSFNAPFYGSEAGKTLPGPITGIVADGMGYLLVGSDGSVYNFNTPFYGSEAGKKPPSPVIGITAAG
jgi:hypothetical protein